MKKGLAFLLMGVMALASVGCGKKAGSSPQEKPRAVITLGAYTVPKEAYQKEILPLFAKKWKALSGTEVSFRESYLASGAQSRAILSGFEADVAALSVPEDVARLEKNGLIQPGWNGAPRRGIVTRSVVVIVTRPGNPKGIKGWKDLTRADVDVLYPSPKTSGGAMWIVDAIYGAGLKMAEQETGKADPAYARKFLKDVQRRVKVMDKSGRASVTTFENGVGDVLLTYENEALLRQMEKKDFPFIVPDATMLIENPAAVVDKNVDRHNNREVVKAFLDFLWTPEAQRAYARYGFRPVDPEVEKEFASKFVVPSQLFDFNYFGGEEALSKLLYGEKGLWTQVLEELSHEE